MSRDRIMHTARKRRVICSVVDMSLATQRNDIYAACGARSQLVYLPWWHYRSSNQHQKWVWEAETPKRNFSRPCPAPPKEVKPTMDFGWFCWYRHITFTATYDHIAAALPCVLVSSPTPNNCASALSPLQKKYELNPSHVTGDQCIMVYWCSDRLLKLHRESI